MSEDKANGVRRLSGACPPGQGAPLDRAEGSGAGGTGSEMMPAQRAYRLFLIERWATWDDLEEIRLFLRRRGWTVLAAGGLPLPPKAR